MQTLSFSVVPTTWNGPPLDLRLLQAVLVLNSSAVSKLFFSACPELGAPLSMDLEEALYKF